MIRVTFVELTKYSCILVLYTEQLMSAVLQAMNKSKHQPFVQHMTVYIMHIMWHIASILSVLQEREARQAVILPYEHQGAGRAYQTDDYKDYLPHSAGGQGKGTGQDLLGHIMYVRDSESDHDSDEDPDDDLDI